MRKSVVFFLCLAAKVAMASGAGGAGGVEGAREGFLCGPLPLPHPPSMGCTHSACRSDCVFHDYRLFPPTQVFPVSISPDSGKLRACFLPFVQCIQYDDHVPSNPHWSVSITLPTTAVVICSVHLVADMFIPSKLGSMSLGEVLKLEGKKIIDITMPVNLGRTIVRVNDSTAVDPALFDSDFEGRKFISKKNSNPNEFLGYYENSAGEMRTVDVCLEIDADPTT